MSVRNSASPPRPRQTVHVGVIGHRPNRIALDRVADLSAECSQVLSNILQLSKAISDPLLYSADAPLLRVISPLAEGADRMVAAAGLELGAELQCPLPFHAREYAADFAEDSSKEEFALLLSRATSIFELEGNREFEGSSYEAVGRLVIAQSDLIVGIWDGEPANGQGGTPQMMEEAIAQGLPVVWLHAMQRRGPCVLQRDEFGGRTERPLDALRDLFAARKPQGEPAEPEPAHEHAHKGQSFDLNHAYCAERHPRLDGSRVYTVFRDLLLKGFIPWRKLTLQNFDEAARKEWSTAMSADAALPAATRAFLLDRLCPYYAWADGLSTYYSGLFRSSSIATNLLSAFAVLCALMGTFFMGSGETESRWERVPTICELTLISCVLAITFWGRHRRWHERWLNYRQLAERLRQYFFLAPLGTPAPAPRALPHFGKDPTRSWVDGTFHAVARDVGMAPAAVSDEYLRSIGSLLNNVLASQVNYHENNHGAMERLTHRLHLVGSSLFGITLLTCVVHLIAVHGENPWVLLLATVPPAFGAAFYGITNHGEFARSADRSLAMEETLNKLRTRDLARVLTSKGNLYEGLQAVSTRVADVMDAETLDWNAVFRYRPLNLP